MSPKLRRLVFYIVIFYILVLNFNTYLHALQNTKASKILVLCLDIFKLKLFNCKNRIYDHFTEERLSEQYS